MLRFAELVAAGLWLSDTCTVKLDKPTSIATPERAPVAASRPKPAGKFPWVTLHE
jgi:hypothetical protein